jgi:WD40 repeat protein
LAVKGQVVPSDVKRVEPIFLEKCVACHNHTARQGGLNLESYEALMNGGRHGPSLVPGKSKESRLVKMIGGSIQPRMPLGAKLTAEEIRIIKAWIAVNTIAFHPSGRWLAGAGADRIIRVWELGENEGRQIKSLIAHEDAINQIMFSPDGKTLVSASADRRVKIRDASKLEEIHTTEVQSDWVFALAFSPDGKRLAVGRYDGSIAFYDPVTGKSLAGK